jgi:erythromycin esterase-like protein
MPLDFIKNEAQILDGSENDYDDLMHEIGDSTIVLLGEASHGTEEFYRERARITKRLVLEKGFNVLALEADWPDAWRVNQYIRIMEPEDSADEALQGFKRFPNWMWRNTAFLNLIDWLHRFNQGMGENERISIFGLDLYSMHASIQAVIQYLETIDPESAAAARTRYGCFEHFNHDMQEYGFFSAHGLNRGCEDEVVLQLVELQRHAMEYGQKNHIRNREMAEEAFFNAEQNARIAKNAERYYRNMFQGHVRSWNLRDTHMADTLELIRNHLEKKSRSPKIIVWAHNSHLGDARATDRSQVGEINIGQLARERYGDMVYSVGFTTHEGTVTAAPEWDKPSLIKRVRPSIFGSWEHLFHQTQIPRFILNLRSPDTQKNVPQRLLERAIGVIYLPQSERHSHYFEAKIAEQFDSVIHIDKTRALTPLDPSAEWQSGEVPETYPSSL